MTIWRIYRCCTPIDLGWDQLPMAAEAFGTALDANGVNVHCDAGEPCDPVLEALLIHAHRIGWEGDFRERPRKFFLPTDCSFETAYAWKQDNNGDTFVAIGSGSLPWLEDGDNFIDVEIEMEVRVRLHKPRSLLEGL